jgi:hypothetical protein
MRPKPSSYGGAAFCLWVRVMPQGNPYCRVADIPILGKRDALRATDQIFLQIIIPKLTRMGAAAERSVLAWQLELAGEHQQVAELLCGLIDGRAELDRVLRLLEEPRR